MIGRPDMQCRPSEMSEELKLKYQRDIFADLKLAIDALKEFNDKLCSLHPDVIYKIRQII